MSSALPHEPVKINFVCDAYSCSKQFTFLPSDTRRNDHVDDTTIELHSLPGRIILLTITLIALTEIKVERMCTPGVKCASYSDRKETLLRIALKYLF